MTSRRRRIYPGKVSDWRMGRDYYRTVRTV